MNAAKILDRNEIWTVLDSFERERKKNKFPLNPQKERLRPNAWVNLILFRLSVCCGLRVSELCNLVIGDIMITGPRPSLRVRANATKATRQIKGKTTKKAVWAYSSTLLGQSDVTRFNSLVYAPN